MAIWLATLVFRTGDGREGRSDWAIEAETAAMAAAMVDRALARDGRARTALDILPLAQAPPADPALLDGVGVATALRESEPVWAMGGGALDLADSDLDDGPAGGPGWIPPALYGALYARTKRTGVFAVLDGTGWPAVAGSLAEDLTAPGAPPAQCLFHEPARSEAGDAAPYVVDLRFSGPPPDDPPSALHARLFLPDTIVPGRLFLLSDLSLAGVVAALRKLTRVRDVDDAWYFNRFWEPEFFVYFLSFLDGRRLLAPLAPITGFAAMVDGGLVHGDTDLSGSLAAPMDRAGDMDLLFEAGTAMVALRHARALEARFGRGCDADAVFAMARDRMGLQGMDYRFVFKCVDIVYSLMAFYGDAAGTRLRSDPVARCFDEEGMVTIFIEELHGLCMFALAQDIAPGALRSAAAV